MLAPFDLNAVRRFTAELKERQRQCATGEGIVCSTLDEAINYHARLCSELRFAINVWARAVFTGEIAFDAQVEDLFRAQVQDLLPHAKKIAAQGREKNWECFELQGLNELHYRIAELDYLQESWVSPRRAVAPAPRVELSESAERQISERLKNLPPLPRDWRPSDPEQIAWYQRQERE